LPGIWPHLESVSNVVPRDGGTYDFDWVYKMAGVPFNGHARAVQVRSGEYVRYQNEGGIPSTFDWSYEATATGTRLTVDVEYTIPTPVIGKLAEGLVAKGNERDLDALLENTKARLETTRVSSTLHTSP
jgi:hypothetical protein